MGSLGLYWHLLKCGNLATEKLSNLGWRDLRSSDDWTISHRLTNRVLFCLLLNYWMSCSLLHSILSLSLLRSKERLEICLFSYIIKVTRCLRLGLEVRLLRKLKQRWIAPLQRLLSGVVKLLRELLRTQLFRLFAKLLLVVGP